MDTKYPRLVTHQQRALAVLRIFIGLWFLYVLWGKVSPEWVNGFHQVVKGFAEHNPVGPYVGFLNEVVIPNAPLFATLVILAELAVGICLVLGMFTAPAALIGIFLNLNYLLATAGQGLPILGLNLTFVVAQFALALGAAGTTWGLDARLLGKAPWWCQGLLHYEYREF